MVTTKLLTAEDLQAMGSDAPYELIMGELVEVSPASPKSSAVAVNIIIPLGTHVKQNRLGVVFGADAGFILAREPDTVRAPDVAFVRKDRLPPGFNLNPFFPGSPDLAVEVISPTNRPRDIERKIDHYLQWGVALIWLVDPVRETIEVIRPSQERRTLRRGDELDGEDVVPGFRLAVATVFDLIF